MRKNVRISFVAVGLMMAVGGMSFPALAMAATTSPSVVTVSALSPGQTVTGTFPGENGATYSVHRLTAQQVITGEENGSISTAGISTPASSSGCWIYLSPTISKTTTYTGTSAGGTYNTSDYIVFRFWNGSGSYSDVVTHTSPTSSASYPFNTTNPAVGNYSGANAYETAYFDLLQTPYGTYKDFDTLLNSTASGSGIDWSYQDGLNANKDAQGGIAFDGPWVCS